MLLYIALIYIIISQTNHNHAILQDYFHLNNSEWNIIGNKNVTAAEFKPFNLNGLMSNFIIGRDKLINVDYRNKDDTNLWFFSKHFPTNFDLHNASIFSFTMSSFVGDFKKLNYENSSVSALIKLINNVTNESVIFPIRNLIIDYSKSISKSKSISISNSTKYNGSLQRFVIPMVNSLWLNGQDYSYIAFNHFKRILQNVTRIDILGDWTQGNETMALDNVLIS
jgi:hypothetical protein